MNGFPIVCRSVIIPENGVAANDTLHRRIEFLHRGRDEQWHGGMTLLFFEELFESHQDYSAIVAPCTSHPSVVRLS